ncbi:hypothetical protein LTR78_001985 [Recurvomyces mirabilis]|uniref:Uncharacterized protein n=1 Tax=Recurvomyces mirabilis TaxID=574656 RepID=A0AAE0WTI6_9PEZI|nr:hypothetical protein LTR78_001985 [Recurvomyces mirabilis]KAK5160443.1 hypothetical protein LTS14_001455 [Recurvomyces mirabilis]
MACWVPGSRSLSSAPMFLSPSFEVAAGMSAGSASRLSLAVARRDGWWGLRMMGISSCSWGPEGSWRVGRKVRGQLLSCRDAGSSIYVLLASERRLPDGTFELSRLAMACFPVGRVSSSYWWDALLKLQPTAVMVTSFHKVRRNGGATRRKNRNLVRERTTREQEKGILHEEIAELKYRLALTEAELNERIRPCDSGSTSADVVALSTASTTELDDDWSVDGSSVVGDWQDDSSVAPTDDTCCSSAGSISATECQYECAEALYASESTSGARCNLGPQRKVVCTRCDGIAAAYAELEQKIVRPGSFAERTRLFDADFYTTVHSKLYIPQKQLMEIETSAHDLVKQVCDKHVQAHCPEVALINFPEWHGELRLGYDEIMDIQLPNQQTGPYRTCIDPCPELRHTMLLGTDLRNSDCHRDFQTPSELERLLAKAQRIAVIFPDEQAASQLRRMRDHLQEAVKTALAEIEMRDALASTMQPERWETHHERFLEWVNFNSECISGMEPIEWPESVVRCARRWQEQKLRPGETDPQYLEDLKQAAKLLVDVSSTNKNSVSEKIESWQIATGQIV